MAESTEPRPSGGVRASEGVRDSEGVWETDVGGEETFIGNVVG